VKSAKAKGRKLQQWVASKISDLLNIPWGKNELIRSREASQSGTDVVLIGKAKDRFPYSIECKYHEKWNIQQFIKQAKSNREDGTDWLLFCKKSYEEPVVIMSAEVFFKLYREKK
jgi:hypothetical protein